MDKKPGLWSWKCNCTTTPMWKEHILYQVAQDNKSQTRIINWCVWLIFFYYFVLKGIPHPLIASSATFHFSPGMFSWTERAIVAGNSMCSSSLCSSSLCSSSMCSSSLCSSSLCSSSMCSSSLCSSSLCSSSLCSSSFHVEANFGTIDFRTS